MTGMHRRHFLASGTVLLSVAIAGCGHPSVVLDMDAATAENIADEVSVSAEPGSEEHKLVTSARENGSATRNGRYDLFDHTDTVRVDDTFYEVSETRLESSEETIYEVYINFDPDDSTPELGEIDYEELPEVDRQHLDPVVSEENLSEAEYDVSVDYGTAKETGNNSVFVPERQYDIIIRGEDRYRVAVNSRTAPEAEYRYEVTEIAPDIDTFAEQIRDQYLFALTGLSDTEREVVEEAINDEYFEDDDAFQSIINRLQEHDGLHVADFDGTWLVEYDGGEYLTYAQW